MVLLLAPKNSKTGSRKISINAPNTTPRMRLSITVLPRIFCATV